MAIAKAQWLERLRGERALIMAALEGASEAELHDAPEGRWSVAGVLRHLIEFEADIMAGIEPLKAGQLPEWTQIGDWHARNVEQAARWPSNPMGDIRQAFVSHRAELEALIEGLSEAEWADPNYVRYLCQPVYGHDFEHLPGILERLARTRGDYREATVRWAEIGRNDILALVFRLPEEAFDERMPGKWSIKEILLHLAGRDRYWAGVIRSVSAGQPEPAPLGPAELEVWNQANVKAGAHFPVYRVFYELAESRGLWAGAMLNTPDSVAQSEAFQRWARGRMTHDRHHLPQIVERYRAWMKRTK